MRSRMEQCGAVQVPVVEPRLAVAVARAAAGVGPGGQAAWAAKARVALLQRAEGGGDICAERSVVSEVVTRRLQAGELRQRRERSKWFLFFHVA